MSEREFRGRFHKMVAACIVFAVVIFGIGFFALLRVRASWDRIAEDQMKSEAEEVDRRLNHQIQKERKIMTGLSALMTDYLKEGDSLAQKLYETNEANGFVSMAYFGTDGTGVMVNETYGVKENVNYHVLGEDVQRIVESAMEGKAAVSTVFDSTVTSHQVFAYSVPVYDEYVNWIEGVLVASGHLDVFEMLLDGEKVMEGNGSVHLVNGEGDLLISSQNPQDARGMKRFLYEEDLFDVKTQQQIRNALEKGESLFCPMSYEGRKFRVYLHPLSYNGWYVMCVHNRENVSSMALRRTRVFLDLMALMFVALVVTFVCTIRSSWKNTRNLHQIAFQDPLTGSDNMQRFMDHLNGELRAGNGFALVAINIYQFKFVNEVLGTAVADDILRYVSTSLQQMVNDGFFCRENADSFCLFLRETDEQTIRVELERMLTDVSQNAVPGKKDFDVRLYAGVFVCSDWATEKLSPERLISRTRFAMQTAKNEYKEMVYFYDAENYKREELKNYVENHMKQALADGEFHLFLQPKMDLRTGKLSSAEALVRWITKEGKMIFPDTFIPLFEKNGFCIQLDTYMFEQACRQIRQWMDAGIEPIPISVNQSKLLFFDGNYIPNLERLLRKYQVPAHMLTLEILEGLMLTHADELNQKLGTLREMGFKISMDDFGSGYSSFNALGSLEIDELKLDRGFLLEMTRENGERFRTIVSSVIEMTKNLNISTVAEGVETLENEALIQSLGCDYGQGYLYSRPVSCEEFSGKYMEG